MAVPVTPGTEVGEVGPAAPRHGRRSLLGRLSLGHVVMVTAGLLGGLLTLAVLRRADETVPVVVAAHDLVPGATVSPDSFGTSRIRAEGDVLDALFTPAEVDDLTGRVVVQRVGAGGLVGRDDLRRAGEGAAPRSMSFAVDRDRAVGGRLGEGDRVDVLAVDRHGGGAGYVMVDAEVLAVDGGGRSGPLGSDDRVTVTLAVESGTAVRLAAALENGVVSLVRSTGAAPGTEAATFEPSPTPTSEP